MSTHSMQYVYDVCRTNGWMCFGEWYIKHVCLLLLHLSSQPTGSYNQQWVFMDKAPWTNCKFQYSETPTAFFWMCFEFWRQQRLFVTFTFPQTSPFREEKRSFHSQSAAALKQTVWENHIAFPCLLSLSSLRVDLNYFSCYSLHLCLIGVVPLQKSIKLFSYLNLLHLLLCYFTNIRAF